jgi:hypothetical protein
MFIPVVLASLLLSIPPASKCRGIADSDTRGFFDFDLDPIVMDVDGDGKPDTITPRLVVTHYRDKKAKLHQAEWIVFDLKTSRGGVVRSFFKYRYGTDQIDYWVWALVSCKVNRDGRRDLVFYAGDDTSDETIVLLNQGNRFRVHSRKVSTDQ